MEATYNLAGTTNFQPRSKNSSPMIRNFNFIWWGAPGPCSSATHGRRSRAPVASYCLDPPPRKINLISCEPMAHVSDIKLIRTDTTLDLSQKAEKGMIWPASALIFYITSVPCCFVTLAMWDPAPLCCEWQLVVMKMECSRGFPLSEITEYRF